MPSPMIGYYVGISSLISCRTCRLLDFEADMWSDRLTLLLPLTSGRINALGSFIADLWL